MNFSNTFIDRPILAGVVSVFILLIGGLAYFGLPVSQYPDVVPPTINVSTTYPGADATTVAATVATPIEQEVNGVENMIYMTSQSTSDGRLSLDVTFELGTDLDQAQVFVQNRVAQALPRLPDQVRQLGVFTQKRSPDLLLVIHMVSPDGRYNTTYLGNYVYLQLRDGLSRLKGVGGITFFGASAYAMRIWLDPDKIAALNITPAEVLAKLRGQNVQVASGTLNQSPITGEQNSFEINIQTKGRLSSAKEFEDIIIKSGPGGNLVFLRDIGRVEIGAETYTTRATLGEETAVGIGVSQRPGTNAIETVEQIKAFLEEAEKDFPPGLVYRVEYNPTNFVEESVEAVLHTLNEAVVLVVLVILIFLQSFRATLIPILAIPISLVGTLAVMKGMGFSLNNLSLFGFVLAIGIVVDDAIVVVENVERRLQLGDSSREAARHTMGEVGTALISIGLVLVAVFLPTMFLEGISGQFFRQFGLTIAVSTIISVFVSLTLSPALAKLLLRPEKETEERIPWYRKPGHFFSTHFNRGMDKLANGYSRSVNWLSRKGGWMMLVYMGLMATAVYEFNRVPTGFIPQQDQGYLISVLQLPAGASLARTEEIVNKISDEILLVDGVRNTAVFSGLNGATQTISSNSGAIFTILDDFEERTAAGIQLTDIINDIYALTNQETGALINTFQPPPVRGIGNGGGFKMMIQDKGNRGVAALSAATNDLVAAANQDPALRNVFTVFNANTPQLYLDIDRERAEKVGVPVQDVFQALEVFIGSAYVNDFNYLGRTYRVMAQADAPYRLTPDDITRLKIRNLDGDMIPLGSLASFEDIIGPDRVQRFNLYNAAAVNGEAAVGRSSGEALAAMERLAKEVLPNGFGFAWTEIAYQQRKDAGTASIAFGLAVLFVFLLLAAQFESLIIPLSIILIVPMGLLAAIIGLDVFGLANDILTQIGMVVLIGLACKNAILIIEFAVQLEAEGKSIYEAAAGAAQLRLRPILMTSFAFILGVIPLVTASGPGSEMRNVLGVAVLVGMTGVSFFGLFFTPVFYVLCRRMALLTASSTVKRKALGQTMMIALLLVGSSASQDSLIAQTADWRWQVSNTAVPLIINEDTLQLRSVEEPSHQWWKQFGYPELNELAETALSGNYDLIELRSRIAATHQRVELARVSRYPQVAINPSFIRQEFSGNRPVGFDVDVPQVRLNTYNIPIDVTYEVDLYGKYKRGVQAAELMAQAATADLQDLERLIVGAIARNFCQLLTLDTEYEVLERTYQSRADNLELVRIRYEAKLTNAIDFERAQTELAAVEISQQDNRRQRHLLELNLALLSGQNPSQFSLDPHTIQYLPPIVTVQALGELIQRRPDFRATDLRMQAEAQTLEQRKRDRYPSLFLQGSFGFLSGELNQLFQGDSRNWLLGGTLSFPLFDGYERRSQIEISRHQLAASQAAVQGRKLLVQQEVEINLANLRQLSAQMQAQQKYNNNARAAAKLSRTRYLQGLVTYLEVVDAERLSLEADQRSVQLLGAQLVGTVNLFQVLGRD